MTTRPVPGSTTRTVCPSPDGPMIEVRRLSIVIENEMTPTGLPSEYTAVESVTTHAPDWSDTYGALRKTLPSPRVSAGPKYSWSCTLVSQPASATRPPANRVSSWPFTWRSSRCRSAPGSRVGRYLQLAVDLVERRGLVGLLLSDRPRVGDGLGERGVPREDQRDRADPLERLGQRVLRDPRGVVDLAVHGVRRPASPPAAPSTAIAPAAVRQATPATSAGTRRLLTIRPSMTSAVSQWRHRQDPAGG